VDVYRQVFAVWQMLRHRKISYSNIIAASQTFGTVSKVFYQYVRTLQDALPSGQANCIDGTVLMASILYRMGLYPVIVSIPGHAYLGYYADQKKQSLAFLETTMLNENASYLSLTPEFKNLAETIAPQYKISNPNSYYTFLNAMQIALDDYRKNKNLFNKNDKGGWYRNDSSNASKFLYQTIDIEKFKSEGLMSLDY
jgi:hypothetical protein